MFQIRRGVFETNSSNTHSITFCTSDEFSSWKIGKLFFIEDKSDFHSILHEIPTFVDGETLLKLLIDSGHDVLSDLTPEETYQTCRSLGLGVFDYDDYFNNRCDGLDDYACSHTTRSGDSIIAFGRYGYDG